MFNDVYFVFRYNFPYLDVFSSVKNIFLCKSRLLHILSNILRFHWCRISSNAPKDVVILKAFDLHKAGLKLTTGEVWRRMVWIANENPWNKGLIWRDSAGSCLLLLCPHFSLAHCMLTASHYHSNWEWLLLMPKIETSSFSISSIDMLSLQAGSRPVITSLQARTVFSWSTPHALGPNYDNPPLFTVFRMISINVYHSRTPWG